MDAIGKAREHAIADLSVAPFARAAQQRYGSPEMRTRIRARDDLLLASGIADMRDVAASARPDQMLSMALETIFQGLGFARTVAFLRTPDGASYSARIGFGPGVRPLLTRLSFEARYHSDAFHAALRHDRVVFIENAHDPEFGARLPAWWKVSLGSARSFVVIPLCAGGEALGLLYGDWNDEMYQMPLNRSQFAHLNDLRALVVSVLTRRQLAEASAAGQA
jgi:GAF domain-containing protein